MAIHILITGTPGCGKTTLTCSIIDQLHGLRLAGFYTQELRGPDGRRVGFQAVGLNGGSETLASVRSKSKRRVGKYGVELPGLEQLIRDELQCGGDDVDLFVVDEIGKMECFSSLFVEVMRELLDGDTPLLATVALEGGGFIGQVKQREDVELIEVDVRNRDDLVGQVTQRLREFISG